MRRVEIDFRQDVPRKETSDWGKAGELNRVSIQSTLPELFTKCDYINAEFQTSNNEKVVVEDVVMTNGVITIPLTTQMTIEGRLRLQFVGYILDEETSELKVIAKTDLVTGIISPSAKGEITDHIPEPSRLETLWVKIKTLWELRHFHSNKEILDTITEDSLSSSNMPVAYINDAGELIFEIGGDISDAWVNIQGELEVEIV